MPFVKVYIHFVWSTKDRARLLNSPELRRKVWEHIKDNAVEKRIFVDTINGYEEHCHCVISMSTDQTVSKVMQLIKGESSNWINKNNLCQSKFEWQDEYFAVSVSESMLDRVRTYIKNQEDHHQRTSFQEEFDQYLTKLGFRRLKDGSIGDERTGDSV